MSDNVYAPPTAEVETVGTDDAHKPFYVVGKTKLRLLYIAIFGLYGVYWMYRNWISYKRFSGEKLIVSLRAIFLVFFVHSLFSHVDDALKDNDKNHNWNPVGLAWAFIVVVVMSNVLDRLLNMFPENGLSLVTLTLINTSTTIALVLAGAAVLSPAQSAINIACEEPKGISNSTLTSFNWMWIVVGAVVWLLILVTVGVTLLVPEALATV